MHELICNERVKPTAVLTKKKGYFKGEQNELLGLSDEAVEIFLWPGKPFTWSGFLELKCIYHAGTLHMYTSLHHCTKTLV